MPPVHRADITPMANLSEGSARSPTPPVAALFANPKNWP